MWSAKLLVCQQGTVTASNSLIEPRLEHRQRSGPVHRRWSSPPSEHRQWSKLKLRPSEQRCQRWSSPPSEHRQWSCSKRASSLIEPGWWLSLQVKKVNVCRWDVFLGLSKRASCSLATCIAMDLIGKIVCPPGYESLKAKKLHIGLNDFDWLKMNFLAVSHEKMKEWTPLGEKWRSEPRLVIHKPSLT